jgi:Xaa-Pro aminopeptidase
MVTRREILQSSAAAAAAAIAPAADASEPAEKSLLEAHSRGAEMLRHGPLMNMERAYKIMAEEQLDGLIVAMPTNLYHLTGYLDHVAVRHDAPAAFALLARDERQAPSIVMSQFLYYYSFVDGHYDYPLNPYLFTGWDGKIEAGKSGPDLSGEAPTASPPFVFNDKGEFPQRDLEVYRVHALNGALAKQSASANAEWALIKAVRDMGLHKGRIAVDHPVIAGIYESAGFGASMVDADHAIRRIRTIKSPTEIKLMRIAAQINADAALAAVKQVRAGATHKELRASFFAEASRRGNVPLFLQIDTVTSEIYDTELKDGEAFAIDAVSLGFHYFGDYGRTVFVGEPSRSMKRATEAISFGWDAVREALKPGLRYSEIHALGREAMKKGGFDFDVAVAPHSVGLAHSDDPGRGGPGAYWVKGDTMLEENMVISVDMPIRHSGVGGSAHLEDLTLITRDGGVQINDIGDRIIMV